jgi:hypothetical protein
MADLSPKQRRERYAQYWQGLKTERSSFDQHWRDLAQWVRPRRERFFASDRNRGDRRNQNIIDSTAGYALRTLQSGLQAGLTSPARPWFKLTTPDPELAQTGPVKDWLHTVEDRMRIVLIRSNIYNALATTYGDYGLFGTAALGVLEDDDHVLRGMSYPIGSYAGTVDGRGRLASFCREFQYTAEQLVEEYGGPDGQPLPLGDDPDWTRFSPAVKSAYDKGDRQTGFPVLQIIQRARSYDVNAIGGRRWPITSCHLQLGDDNPAQAFLREGGFPVMPIMMPRWDVTAEDAYGTDCPGMMALGDIRQLQLMQKEKAKAIQKTVNPPVMAPSSVRSQAVSLLPADITYVDVREGQQGIRPIHEMRFPVAEVMADIQDTRGLIDRAFFVDLFQMISRDERGAQPITAEEVRERHEEKLIALGPVLERTNDELLDPLIDIAFQIMQDAKLIPPAPPDLHGVALTVEYVSLMAQSQKLVAITGQDRFLQSVTAVSQVWPEARHKVNALELVNGYADFLGVNPKIVRSDDEATAAATQEAQAQQQAQQLAALESQAKTTQALGNTPVTGDTALGRMLGAVST